ALARTHLRPQDRLTVRDAGGRPAALWPLTQVIHAAVLAHEAGVPDTAVTDVTRSLGRYDTPRGWTATPRPHLRRVVYHDDNAWLGLALTQGLLLAGDTQLAAPAERALDVARRGEDPRGGVRWNERVTSRHACASGPTALLALRLAEATGLAPSADTAMLVDRQLAFLDVDLARSDGLVADHVGADGTRHRQAWTYNQGAALGAHRLAGELLGRDAGAERSLALARTAVGHWTRDRLWREPPAFVAVLARQLLALDAARGTDEFLPWVDGWLDRVATEGLDPGTDLVGAGGIGRYGDSRVIDQAAVVQVAALRSLPPERRVQAC
ncbi:MAG: glycoside hydrolase family 76 protein, partial [Actinomycetales bacterium]